MTTDAQKRVEGLCETMLAAAKKNLVRDGNVANIVFAIAPTNEMIFIRMDDFPRNAQPLAVRVLVKTVNAEYVVHVSEAWGAVEHFGHEIGIAPSKREDKVEVILVHALARNGLQSYSCVKFDRLENGGYEFSEWKPPGFSGEEGGRRYESRLLDGCFEWAT